MTPSALEEHIGTTGRELLSSIRAVLDAVPGAPHRPQELARALGVKKDVSSRLLMATSQSDVVAATSVIPGPESLRQLLRSAARKGVASDLIRAGDNAVDDFERLIRDVTGDRSGLDAVIGTMLHDARLRYETACKQAAFKGASGVRGVFTETYAVTFLIHPSQSDPTRCDTVMLAGLYGLRRLRPRVPVRFTTVLVDQSRQISTLHPANGEGRTPLLREFCVPADLPTTIETIGDRVYYGLGERGVGPRSSVDLVLGELYSASMPVFASAGESQNRRCYATVEQPSRALVFDLLIHKSLWAGLATDLRIYDTTINGAVDPFSPTSVAAELDIAETIQSLGRGVRRFRTPDVPRYVELLTSICERMNWNPDEFEGRRCRITYPFYGSQVCYLFALPMATTSRPS